MNQSYQQKNTCMRKNDLLAPSTQKSIYYYRNKSHEELQHQNQKVLTKLMQISQRKPTHHFSCSRVGTKNNTFYRKKYSNKFIYRQLKSIEQENIKIGTRLIALPSTFHRDQMRRQIKNYQQLKRRLTNNRRHAFNVINEKNTNKMLPKLRDSSNQSLNHRQYKLLNEHQQPSQQFFWQKGRSKTEEITFQKNSKSINYIKQKSYSQLMDNDQQINNQKKQNLTQQDSMNIQVLLQEVSTPKNIKNEKKKYREKKRLSQSAFAENYHEMKSKLFN